MTASHTVDISLDPPVVAIDGFSNIPALFWHRVTTNPERLVIREKDGIRTYERLDLQSDEIFTSPYFYLQQNDVIYVEPLKARVATVADPAQRLISYSTAALSLITLVIALTR